MTMAAYGLSRQTGSCGLRDTGRRGVKVVHKTPNRLPKDAEKSNRKAKFYSMSLNNIIFDCSLRSHWVMQERYQDAEGNEVAALDMKSAGPDFVELPPDSLGAFLVDFVCKWPNPDSSPRE